MGAHESSRLDGLDEVLEEVAKLELLFEGTPAEVPNDIVLGRLLKEKLREWEELLGRIPPESAQAAKNRLKARIAELRVVGDVEGKLKTCNDERERLREQVEFLKTEVEQLREGVALNKPATDTFVWCVNPNVQAKLTRAETITISSLILSHAAMLVALLWIAARHLS